ncbi:Phytosulfokines 3 [Spatholobus suberectus]|nr:Phytosulfokines 3 [Spatholobus suberectus]
MKTLSKVSVCMAALSFLFLTLTYAGRTGPASSYVISNNEVLEEEMTNVMTNVEETCQGIGEEECLMRRTLAAHTDYIYTQKLKP